MICSVDPPGCKDIDDALHCRHANSAILNKLWGSGNTNIQKGFDVVDISDDDIEK